jgi:hypothetical protein
VEEKDLKRGILTYEVRIKNQRHELVTSIIIEVIVGRRDGEK